MTDLCQKIKEKNSEWYPFIEKLENFKNECDLQPVSTIKYVNMDVYVSKFLWNVTTYSRVQVTMEDECCNILKRLFLFQLYLRSL